MSTTAELAQLEAIVDASGVSTRIEAMLPIGVRPRQLSVRTLLLGILICLADKRPAHLTRIHQTLTCLPEADKRRLGVIAQWKSAEHELTYRQTERTFGLVVSALCRERRDGAPSQTLSEIIDRLLEASVTILATPESSALAIDWTDYESFARPPHKDGRCADTEAAWGHRKANHPGKAELFFGYYLQAATIVREESGPEVPELVRRIILASCEHDPPAQIVPVAERMTKEGIALGDLLVDCGYSYRQAESFAMPMRALGAALVMDLHPSDRGMKGTHQGAILANGRLYCPATPKSLLGSHRPRRAPASSSFKPTIEGQRSLPATSSRRSAPSIAMATTASAARRFAASSAAHCAPHRWRSPTSAPRSSPRLMSHRSAAASRRSRSHRP